ncbi:redoxin domain-containing protein [Pontibacter rufus]|uniref:redoxin domain-containing protein n=1 Tax=Pontibacter rufus TaxID=2791028 RepID=UPI001E4D7DA3|nr:redoxin domain-containing protein [Pontibacter sp. 172403-2]
MLLEKGTAAPDFELNATPDQKLKLSELKGKRVVLVFYPADWSPVCGDQIALYNEMLKFFQKYNAQIIGISVDSKWCHMAFADNRNIHFPLLADFEPKGEVSKLYGAYNEENGNSRRALFVIDEAGIIRWSYLSPDGINPGADGILEALEELENNKDKK